MNKQTKILLVICSVVLIGAFQVNGAYPDGNPSLLNTSNTAQIKSGGLLIGNSTDLDSGLVIANGKMGVGVASPSATLDINGRIAITDGTQSAGAILTSRDNQGNAYWKSPGSSPSSIDLPIGSIVPFNSSSCPSGWSAYSKVASRVIVGAGLASGGSDPQGATSAALYSVQKTFGQTGGSTSHTLTLNESYHSHGLDSDDDDTEVDGGKGADSFDPDSETQNTNVVGGDPALGGLAASHSEMQPYIVLLYCVKSNE